MKVLLISDNQTELNRIDNFLKSNGYDTIIYHWLLKALDNIEEISPDVTVVSVYDYPRHWKTLAQFENSGIARNNSEIILYVPENFSEDEKKKARALGVKGFFNSCDERGLNSLLEMLFVKDDPEELSFTNTTLDKPSDVEEEGISETENKTEGKDTEIPEIEKPETEIQESDDNDFLNDIPTVDDILNKHETVETAIPVPDNMPEIPVKKHKGSLLARMQELRNA